MEGSELGSSRAPTSWYYGGERAGPQQSHHELVLWSEPGSPRLSHLCRLLLPTSSTPTSPAVAGPASLAILVYAVVNSRIDYCNTVLVRAPRTVTDKLQRVLNAAARVITGSRKFDRGLGRILHDELHWLDVPDRVFFKLAVTVHRCLNGRAPPYLSDYCVPAAGVDTRQHTNRQLLAVPRYRLNTNGCRAFSVAGPTVWNSLPDFIQDPTISADCFRRLLQTYLFAQY